MNILHYSLGFPPYRSGGLTKFCLDLAKQQIAEGHTVGMLWPGEMRLGSHGTIIKKSGSIARIQSYEVVNPTPVSYDEGITEIEAFLDPGEEAVYLHFLKELKPDVIHIHTLMGMHKSLLSAAKQLGIRTCFTTHDFFPICPKVTLFRDGDVCKDAKECASCPACNQTALSLQKIRLLQTPAYRKWKDTSLVRKLRKEHRDAYLGETLAAGTKNSRNKPEDYRRLRDHYGQMLAKTDIIHFNSTAAKNVYDQFFPVPDFKILPITHADVADHRAQKEFSGPLRIAYLGPQSAHKGYFILKKALDQLWEERKDFLLHVYFEPTEKREYEVGHPRYSYEDLGDVMNRADVVIVPSIWYETFGFTAQEAMSYAVPVILSSHVGAKDIIPEGGGIVFDDISSEGILQVFRNLDGEKIVQMNEVLCQTPVRTMEQMSREIRENCYQDG